jgi:hypothetical protein
MPALTAFLGARGKERRRVATAAALAAAVAIIAYTPAAWNDFAMDDIGVIALNPAVHSPAAAWEARFSPYWPVTDERSSGLYRPAVIATYGLDWWLSDGTPAWFHLVNVALHGVATALVVLVLAAWLPPVGALAAGLVFAVHPVHVEAVANVVGRAEILATIGMLGTVLAARRCRLAAEPGTGDQRPARGRAVSWGALAGLAAAFALFSKEHAVVTILLVAVDHALDSRRARMTGAWTLYLALAAVTVAWFHLWRAVAGPYVGTSVAAALREITFTERLATMLPAYLDVLRLLTLPLDLSHDYNPQVIPQRLEFGLLALFAAVVVAAIGALAAAGRRRSPSVAFALAAAIATYAPTGNLLFASGVVLAERTLYLAAIAPAAVVGVLVTEESVARIRRLLLVAVGALLALYMGRTVTRIPFWRDNRMVVVEGVLQHPESFRVRVQFAGVLERQGDSAMALAEYLAAGALFDRDPYVPQYSAPLALAMGAAAVAEQEALRAYVLRPSHPLIARTLVRVLVARGARDSARVIARETVERAPSSITAAETLLGLVEAEAPAWEAALLGARLDWMRIRLTSATRGIEAAVRALDGSPDAALAPLCWELRLNRLMLDALAPEARTHMERFMRETGEACDVTTVSP